MSPQEIQDLLHLAPRGGAVVVQIEGMRRRGEVDERQRQVRRQRRGHEAIDGKANDADAPITKAAQGGRKGQITIVAYVLAIGVAFLWPYAAIAIYVAVALMWLVPDRRFEALIG